MMKKQKFQPKDTAKKLQLKKTVISDFDVQKVKGGGWPPSYVNNCDTITKLSGAGWCFACCGGGG